MNTALRAIQLKAKHQVYTLLSGQNLSKLYGEGYDFAELREYQIGDDIRKINWTITAKLSKPYIKQLHANRELSVVIACFMDAGLYFGPKNSPHVNAKQMKMTEVATLLGYATYQQGDLFTGIAYTEAQTYATPPSKQLYTIEQFSQALFEMPLLETTLDTKHAIKDLFQRIQRPSLVIVLADFLEEIDLSLLAQKHEVIAIVIRNKEEESPKILGEATLANPKNNETKEAYFGKRSHQTYKTELFAHETQRLEHFRHYNIRSITLYTDEEAISKLITLFT